MLKLQFYKFVSNFYSPANFIFSNLIFVAFLLTTVNATSQQTKYLTSFEKTDILIKENKLDEAYQLMKRYQISNSTDFNATWKTAQLAYWNSEIDNSKKLYDVALELDPTNYLVKYDYAKMLFEIGDYKKAALLFEQYRTVDSENPEVWIYSVKNDYYDNELNKAMDLYKQMPSSLNANPELSTLKSEISAAKATNISLSMGYVDDNQPMQTFIPKLRISKMYNSYLNLYVEGSFNTFSNDTLNSNSQTFKLGNKFAFTKLKLKADVSVGATILGVANESAVIGGLLLSKKIVNGVALNAELSRNPYYYSLPSARNFVLQDNAGIALSISDIEKFSGNFQYQKQMFNDDNFINANSLWVLSPGLGTDFVTVKIGYAFEAMDSDKDNYTAIKSFDEIVADFATTPFIEGVYLSYFTPQNQKIHSALVAVELKLAPKLNINLTGSYGFSAKWENPYLFLNEDANNQLFIDKGYTQEDFKPANYKADLNYAISPKLNMGLHYDYFKTAFYTANTFMLNLNYKIISEK